MGTRILTTSRVYFDLLAPDPAAVHLEDIAHALAGIVRYTAHGRRVSVAEHSCNVYWRVRELEGSVDEQRAGLMHDSPEAYCGDVSGPLKEAMRVLTGRKRSVYDQIEHGIWRCVARRFGLPEVIPEIVHRVDREMLTIEAPWVFGSSADGWGPPVAEATRIRFRPEGWRDYKAEERFLAAAKGLGL